MKRVLLTGANGYIGRRLKHALLSKEGIELRLMVRNANSLSSSVQEHAQIVTADVLNPASLDDALRGIDVAYYLIHGLNHGNFREIDRQSAQNFVDACVRQNVKTIIYLGGLGDKKTGSEHLLSRIETGEILSSRPDKINCIWFRAGVIIGSGSASFEIIRHLVQKLPVMITPKWVRTPVTPIGVDDVIDFLLAALDLPATSNLMVDLGEEAMSYGDLMLRVAKAMGLKRYLIPVNVLTPKLSSYWLAIFTPVPYSVSSSLIEGLRSEVTVSNNLQHDYFTIKPHTLEETVKRAIGEIESNQVLSRWSDSGSGAWEVDHSHDIADALFIDRRIIELKTLSPDKVFRSFCSIGGENGWFGYDWLWNLRGFIDKLFKGAGINRGRRNPNSLRIGDSVDFWKVVDLVENERLLLFAQMKLPGKAWLEFKIHDGKLIQSAYFYPYGIVGRLYWYILIPLHYLIFTNMALSIINRSK
ncbi:SDR family oxidoreductase [Sulfuricurvum sp.]|uniref:SDR family oxidoreductase n=1 Tax=Sulfuricurvum sp. TaxID=2025608 RepID=UPI00262FDF1A|nr:SDR family oxidoreductase [Sulfuricurvum sp.]MDD2266693.1 SDR family oxidoreductase [Sulfuricurvum sp.]MDD2784141.1 SDR family oxidoreductase [Sulfuricurvum sp.]